MKIVFVTRNISGGGAERQLLTLAGALARHGEAVSIVSLYPPAADVNVPDGVALLSAQKRARWDIAGFYLRLIGLLRRQRADIIHPYLPVPNCLIALCSPFLGGARIVFGLRASGVVLSHYDWLSALSYRLERLLSRRADLLIANAAAGRADAVARGYPAGRIAVVHNGIDTAAFISDRRRGDAWRARWNIAAADIVVGHVGRLDPMKDHETFLTAMAKLPNSVRAVVIGAGAPEFEARLRRYADALGIADRVEWTGAQRNMTDIYNALDILCLSSAFGEGFPNVVAEAMACGVPCVATDVGDSAFIVGATGRIVPPRNPERMSAALGEIAAMSEPERRALGMAARRHIVENFSIDRLAGKTRDILAALVANRTAD